MAGRKKGEVRKPETEEEKFVRLAEQRTNQALKYIGLVGNLSGPGYKRSPEQVTFIFDHLQEALDRAKDRFGGKTLPASGFCIPKADDQG